jgi:RNA polymerase sigma factor (TIGR02999 family)
MSEVTRILNTIEHGDPAAAAKLLPLVYDELRRLAARHLRGEKPGQTLQPTALVHEAFLRLVGAAKAQARPDQGWDGTRHFFAAAAEAMRRILVENARRKHRIKRGGGRQRIDLEKLDASTAAPSEDLLALNEALEQFAAEEPEKAELVKLRFFAGLSAEEAAHCLGISRATAARHWTYARAWLYDRLDPAG